jgi:hypothetical protein
MLNRDDLPVERWKHRYQLGFFLLGRIWWRTVSREKFLREYYLHVSTKSHPLDILAVFHAGDVQRFRRTAFRALRV